jgi:hypothetical protein
MFEGTEPYFGGERFAGAGIQFLFPPPNFHDVVNFISRYPLKEKVSAAFPVSLFSFTISFCFPLTCSSSIGFTTSCRL